MGPLTNKIHPPMRHLSKALLALILAILPLQAQDDESSDAASKVTLISDHQSIAPGSTFTAALHLYHPEGWHSYYRNTGGIELPPEISWTLPEGFKAGPIQWPVPKVKDGDFGTSFIYPNKVTLLVDIAVPADIEVGSTATVTIKAESMWQICDTGCISEDGEFSLEIPVTETAILDPGSEEIFKQARAKLPVSSDAWSFSAEEAKDSVTLTFKAGDDFSELPADFIPDQAFIDAASKGGKIERDGDSIVIQLPRKTVDAFDDPIEQGKAISGIVVGAEQSALVPLTKIGGDEETLATEPESEDTSLGSLLSIFGGMFLGGLILNLMPCVFPVIGIKIMGFVQQAGEDRKKVMFHGLTFTLGVLISFAVLSVTLFALKETFGWGDQLAEPWFALIMLLLMFLLGMNMFGVFEIGAKATSIGGNLQAKSGYAGSFFSGALATLIATPCAAPFLGGALGATIALPTIPFFTSFALMALGLSAPYLVLSAFPKLVESLPRPGAWMESFKQSMSFLLFATAGYILWFYAIQVEMNEMEFPWPIFGLCLIGVSAWIYGKWNLPHLARKTRAKALILTVLFATGGVYLAKPPAEVPTVTATGEKVLKLEWEKWSHDKTQVLLSQGIPVYIDFTAKWCVTCQVNKGRAYTQDVIKKMDELDVVALKADKTKKNPEINKAIKAYGRAAIPVNVLLIPGKDPIILPELLGPKDVLKALEEVPEIE